MAAQKPERLKAADVCRIAQLQPYVLRSWEAEFPDLGQATAGGPRIYGRADVERVLQIRELIDVEGLTLSGARRRLEEARAEAAEAAEAAAAGDEAEEPAAEDSLLDASTRDRLKTIRDGLVHVLSMLDRPVGGVPFELVAATGTTDRPAAAKPARRSKR